MFVPALLCVACPAGAQAQHKAVSETKEVYGKSVQGRPLTAYIMGNGGNVTCIFGAFHGNERSSVGVVQRLRTYLKNHAEALENCKVVLVPCANPDGWYANTRTNAHGVDLNRNFPFHWQAKAASKNTNPGPKPASEPETQAMMRLLSKYKPSKVISLHSPFHELVWTANSGLRMAQVMRNENGYKIAETTGYPTPGSFGNYCGKQLNIGIVTLELPSQSADAAWKTNQAALLAAIHFDVREDKNEGSK